jgi:hypothetical protein
MSELKSLLTPRSLPARRSVKEIVADGFEDRQKIRKLRRKISQQKNRRYTARRKALEAAMAVARNSAIQSAKAANRAKPQNPKAAGGVS